MPTADPYTEPADRDALSPREQAVYDVLAARYRGAVPPTPAMIDAVLAELPEDRDPRAGLGPRHHEDPARYVTGSEPGDCPRCAPFACDDPDAHLGVPAEYAIPGCHCGAASDGRDCMCFEDR